MSLMFARMMMTMVSVCIVTPYVLKLATFLHGLSKFATTFCWKLKIVPRVSCSLSWMSEVVGWSAQMMVASMILKT